MRRIALVFLSVLFSFGLVADEIFIPIAGSVGVFSTDMRLVNPSDEAIVIQASYLPRHNVDNSAVQSKEVTIPPRQMAVYDDVVASLFQAGDLGAIRLISEKTFGATARIFAQSSEGTLGQFVVGVPVEGALEKGILLQLESSADFRTNLGMANPDREGPATVDLVLYGADNSVLATASMALQPWGVVAPTNIVALFSGVEGDLSDAWVSYSADKPVIVYGSVIDNGTTDPTYVPAIADPGVATVPPEQKTRTFDVTAFQWGYTFRENGEIINNITIAKGTRVVMRFQTSDVQHGFNMSPYMSVIISPGTTQEHEFIADQEGRVEFFCTVESCGAGHPTMSGSLQIGAGGGTGTPGYLTTSAPAGDHAGSADHSHHHHE